MLKILKIALMVFGLSLPGALLAQGQTDPIFICLKPEMKTNTRNRQVFQDVDTGDKVKGLLYQSKRSDLTCQNLESVAAAVPVQNIFMKVHGQSSQSYNQKSYAIEFVDKDYKPLEKDQQLRFAGLPRGQKFILTSNYVDRSDLRNPLAFSLAAQMARDHPDANGKPDYFATPFTFAQVRVGREYKGLYTLSARIERGKERLDIAKVTEDHFEGFDWIGEICTGVKDADYHSKRKTFFAFRYPEFDDLFKFKDQSKAERAKQSMIARIEHFEDVLSGPGFADPASGYASMIDVPSFIDFILLEELAKNVDGLRRSVWFRFVDGKIRMGPVWDFDIAFGNASVYNMWSSKGWLLDFGQDTWSSRGGIEHFPAAFWFRRLVEDPAFAAQLKARYIALRKPGGAFHNDNIKEIMNRLYGDIGDAGARNEARWAMTHFNPLHSLIFHAPPFDRTYEGNLTRLGEWIKDRLIWIDANLPSIAERGRMN